MPWGAFTLNSDMTRNSMRWEQLAGLQHGAAVPGAGCPAVKLWMKGCHELRTSCRTVVMERLGTRVQEALPDWICDDIAECV